MSLSDFLNHQGDARNAASRAPAPPAAPPPPPSARPSPGPAPKPRPAARPNFFDALRAPPPEPEPEPEPEAVAPEPEAPPPPPGPSWLSLTQSAAQTLARGAPRGAAPKGGASLFAALKSPPRPEPEPLPEPEPTSTVVPASEPAAAPDAEEDGPAPWEADWVDPSAPPPVAEPLPEVDATPLDAAGDPLIGAEAAPHLAHDVASPVEDAEPDVEDASPPPPPAAETTAAAPASPILTSFAFDEDAPKNIGAEVLTVTPPAPQIQVGADVIRPDVRRLEEAPSLHVEVVRRVEAAPRVFGATAWSGADESFHGPRRARVDAHDDEAERRKPRPQASFDAALIASALASSPREDGRDVLIVRSQRLLPAPGGDFLWRADYSRQEGDLILRVPRRDPLVVRHYFAADVPPDLATPEGLRLEASVAAALAASFSERPIPPPPGSNHASVSRLTGAALVKRPGQSRQPLQLRDRVLPGDLVESVGDAKLSLNFGRALRIDLCAEARLRVDNWSGVHRDDGGIVELTLLRGAFAAIAAMSGAPPLVSMRTPAGTVSWSDASLVGQAALLGEPSQIALLRRGSGVAGSVTLVNGFGAASFNKAGVVIPLRGHHAPGDPYPLTDYVLARSAYAPLLPSKQVAELERRAAGL